MTPLVLDDDSDSIPSLVKGLSRLSCVCGQLSTYSLVG